MFKRLFSKPAVILEITPKVNIAQNRDGKTYLVDGGENDLNRVLEKLVFSKNDPLNGIQATGFDKIYTNLSGSILSSAKNEQLDLSVFVTQNNVPDVLALIRNEILEGKGIVLGNLLAIKGSNPKQDMQVIGSPIYAIRRSSDGIFMDVASIKHYILEEWAKSFDTQVAADSVTHLHGVNELLAATPLTSEYIESNADNHSTNAGLKVDNSPQGNDTNLISNHPVNNHKPVTFVNRLANSPKMALILAVGLFFTVVTTAFAFNHFTRQKEATSSESNLFANSPKDSIKNSIEPVSSNNTNGYGFKDKNGESYNNGVMSAEQLAALQIKTSEDMLKSMNIDVNDNSDLGCFTENDSSAKAGNNIKPSSATSK